MNGMQIQYLKSKTCYLLDCAGDLDEGLIDMNIPKRLRQKVTKALDLLFEVNQAAIEAGKNKPGPKTKRETTYYRLIFKVHKTQDWEYCNNRFDKIEDARTYFNETKKHFKKNQLLIMKITEGKTKTETIVS